MNGLALPIPEEFLQSVEELVRRALVDALALERGVAADGFLDVAGAAAYLASTPPAIRALVKRRAIPFHKAPNGRILFDRNELDTWVRVG
jgi:excisionase family DNA binding protein